MHKTLLGAAALLVAVAVTAAACGDDDAGHDPGPSAIVTAITFLDDAGLHGIDESINEDGEIPAGAATTARRAQAVVALTDWPADLQEEAEALEAIFDEMAETLGAEEPDIAAAGDVAARAHDGQHDFSGAVWDYLQVEAGIEPAEAEHSEE